MQSWILVFILLVGSLFAIKIAYVLSVTMALPFTRGALYVSTSRRRIEAFLDAVPMKPYQVVIDLGCGDGRVLRKVYKRYGVKAIGYEMNLLAYVKARLLSLGFKSVTIRLRNFWKADLSKADIIFCYLYPDVMRELSKKLRKELRPGTVVVSCNFPLPAWRSARVLRPGNNLHNDPIYIYGI